MELKHEWIAPVMKCIGTCFIVDEQSKEIVWSNDDRKSLGLHCYTVILGREDPCPFCPALTENELYVWDHYDNRSQSWLQVKNVLFRYHERMLRVTNYNRIDDAMALSHESVEEISTLQKLLKENQRIKDALEREATHDRMTGLLNRNRFNLDIASGTYDSGKIGVLYFDLNNLKEVNDTYRHEAGDRLIICLANTIGRLSGEMQPSRCYRIGGDEFVLMLPECSEEALEYAITRFREIIKEFEDETPRCSVAVGGSFSMEPCDAEGLVQRADHEMYICKQKMKGLAT